MCLYQVKPIECKFKVTPSTKINGIEIFYQDPNNPDADPVKLKQGINNSTYATV